MSGCQANTGLNISSTGVIYNGNTNTNYDLSKLEYIGGKVFEAIIDREVDYQTNDPILYTSFEDYGNTGVELLAPDTISITESGTYQINLNLEAEVDFVFNITDPVPSTSLRYSSNMNYIVVVTTTPYKFEVVVKENWSPLISSPYGESVLITKIN